ncbi:MAG: hypothetical protein AAB449_00070 [Patescibacteria group bacterium]
MALGWSARRQLLYYAVGTAVLIALSLMIWVTFFIEHPTCFDQTQNGSERGVDCGGSCALICAAEAKVPTVLWSRSFNTAPTLYTAAAYIQNNNLGAGAKSVSYSFQLYDENNLLVKEKTGTIDLPPVLVIPIVEHNINVGNRTVVRTQLCFNFDPRCLPTPTAPPVWNKILARDLPALRVTEQQLTAGGTRLAATLQNDSLKDARSVTIAAVLFDAQGVARAAAKSLLDIVPRKSSQPLVFTWPYQNPNIVRVEINVLPSF